MSKGENCVIRAARRYHKVRQRRQGNLEPNYITMEICSTRPQIKIFDFQKQLQASTYRLLEVPTEDRQRSIWNNVVPPATYHPFCCWLASPLGFTMLPTTTIQPTTHQPTTTSITRTPSSSWVPKSFTSKKQTAPKPRDLNFYFLLCFSSSLLVFSNKPLNLRPRRFF